MVSIASDGTAERIAARICFSAARPLCGTAARYSSQFFGGALRCATVLRFPAFAFFMRTMLQAPPPRVHPSVSAECLCLHSLASVGFCVKRQGRRRKTDFPVHSW